MKINSFKQNSLDLAHRATNKKLRRKAHQNSFPPSPKITCSTRNNTMNYTRTEEEKKLSIIMDQALTYFVSSDELDKYCGEKKASARRESLKRCSHKAHSRLWGKHKYFISFTPGTKQRATSAYRSRKKSERKQRHEKLRVFGVERWQSVDVAEATGNIPLLIFVAQRRMTFQVIREASPPNRLH